jgi:hypothetical protein
LLFHDFHYVFLIVAIWMRRWRCVS